MKERERERERKRERERGKRETDREGRGRGGERVRKPCVPNYDAPPLPTAGEAGGNE